MKGKMLTQDDNLRSNCHSILWHKASQLFSSVNKPDLLLAKEFYIAAYFFSTPSMLSKAARMVSACCLKQGDSQRATEYLDIAAKHEQTKTVISQMMRLQAMLDLNNQEEALKSESNNKMWPPTILLHL